MRRQLLPATKLPGASPFTLGQIRWFLFNAHSNGLDAVGAIVRVGRRVYIDVDRFWEWIDASNGSARRAGA